MYAVYILEYTQVGKTGARFYAGQSQNPHHRICAHFQGTGARWPRLLGVKSIVRVQYVETRDSALSEEKRLADLLHAGWIPHEQPARVIAPRFLQQFERLP